MTLIYSFEKKGVLRNAEDEDSVISHINKVQFEQYVREGIIQGGMIPKLENAFQALDAGVNKIIITLASAIGAEGGTTIEK